jgi:fumarate reductase subunit C
VFVIACAVHAPIGALNVIGEISSGSGALARVVAMFLRLLILALGLRAVWAVVA